MLAAGECGGEGEIENQMRRGEAHGRVLGLDVAHDSPSWPGRAAKWQRAAPHGIEALKMVGTVARHQSHDFSLTAILGDDKSPNPLIISANLLNQS